MEKREALKKIHVEMLKAYLDTPTKIFTDLFQLIWAEDTIPDERQPPGL